jgi:hypothetical protein
MLLDNQQLAFGLDTLDHFHTSLQVENRHQAIQLLDYQLRLRHLALKVIILIFQELHAL